MRTGEIHRGAPLVALVLAAAAAACTPRLQVVDRPRAPEALEPAHRRITDETIARDHTFLRSLQHRLEAVNAAGRPLDDYHFCKAQAWLDLAFAEYADNDRTGVIDSAVGEARGLIRRFEAGETPATTDTPIVTGSERVREDLWQLAGGLKAGEGMRCAGCDVARLEVQLVWVGHERRELGWRHAEPQVRAAERIADVARSVSESCPPARTPEPEPEPEPELEPAAPAESYECACPEQPAPCEPPPAPTAAEREQALAAEVQAIITTLPRRIHFGYDSAEISGPSGELLDELAAVLLDRPRIALTLSGHTDSRGASDYNMRLGRRRARAVESYLVSRGVDARQIRVVSLGEAVPRAGEEGPTGLARNRRVDIRYDDAPDIVSEDRELDLQADG